MSVTTSAPRTGTASASSVAYLTTLSLRMGYTVPQAKLQGMSPAAVRVAITTCNKGLTARFQRVSNLPVAPYQSKLLAAIATLLNVQVPQAANAGAADALIIKWAKSATPQDIAYVNSTLVGNG